MSTGDCFFEVVEMDGRHMVRAEDEDGGVGYSVVYLSFNGRRLSWSCEEVIAECQLAESNIVKRNRDFVGFHNDEDSREVQQ